MWKDSNEVEIFKSSNKITIIIIFFAKLLLPTPRRIGTESCPTLITSLFSPILAVDSFKSLIKIDCSTVGFMMLTIFLLVEPGIGDVDGGGVDGGIFLRLVGEKSSSFPSSMYSSSSLSASLNSSEGSSILVPPSCNPVAIFAAF
jgi:hypothetical protein